LKETAMISLYKRGYGHSIRNPTHSRHGLDPSMDRIQLDWLGSSQPIQFNPIHGWIQSMSTRCWAGSGQRIWTHIHLWIISNKLEWLWMLSSVRFNLWWWSFWTFPVVDSLNKSCIIANIVRIFSTRNNRYFSDVFISTI